MAEPDFYYQCEVCKAKIPAMFASPILPEGQEVAKRMGEKVEVMFRCPEHRVDPPTDDA
jgi:hypothetical protein